MAELVMQDVAEAVVIDKQTGQTAVYANLQLSGLEGSISEEDLRAGIGNGKIFKIRTDKELNVNLRTATVDLEWLAMQQGVEVESAQSTRVTKVETVEAKADGADFVVNIKGTPMNNEVRVTGVDGEQDVATAATGEVILPATMAAKAGDKIVVTYYEEVTGKRIQFDAAKFAKSYRLELRTIAYDLDSAEVYSDIYFIFENAIPSGDMSFSLESGSVVTPELTFSILSPKGTTVMGEMYEIVRS